MADLDSSARPRGVEWLGASLAAAVTLSYFLLWWNRFLGVTTDGWFFYCAQRILQGAVPYRDFYLFAPPLHALKLAALISLFGEKLLIVKAVGLAERAAAAAILYFWLRRIASPVAALISAVAGLVLFAGDISETLSFFGQEAVILAVFCGFLGQLASEKAGRHASWLAFACGLLAAWTFFTKQTTGAAVTVGIPLLWLIVDRRDWRSAARRGAWFAAGWTLPAAAILGWLAANGALRPFAEQVFRGGAASKGALIPTLLRPLTSPFGLADFRTPATWAVLALLGLLVILRVSRPGSSARGAILAGALGLLGVLLFGVAVARHGLRFPQLAAIYGALLICAWAAARDLRRPLASTARLFMALFSLGVAYACALSWPAYESMLLPSLPLALAVGFAPERSDPSGPARRALTVAACLLALTCATAYKLNSPYRWGGWFEPPVSRATARSRLPELAGFWLSPETAGFLETVVADIKSHSRPDDPVFVFPDLPLLYALADRHPPTFAFTHWFDVAPDAVALADAAALRQRPPAVLVYLEIGAEYWHMNEREFRGGAASGQTVLRDTLLELGQSPEYSFLRALETPVIPFPIGIWARKDRLAAADGQ